MGEHSPIQWCHHTFNPWWGCVNVSPGCDNCYAERDAKRYAPTVQLWGPGSTRRTFSTKHWWQPVLWDRKAQFGGRRDRVFCASMADVFDKDAPPGERERLWQLIKTTTHLDWLLLTKRIGNAPRMLPSSWGDGWPNVWLGISVVNQEEADRDIPKLLEIPASVRWLSIEPMLGPVALHPSFFHASRCSTRCAYPAVCRQTSGEGISWVIVGGESGPRARPMDLDWARSIVDQCAAGGAACFVKQIGARPHDTNPAEPTMHRELRPRDRKGGDPFEWPDELRVRQFPPTRTYEQEAG